jgi:hypothetical protein
VDCIENEKIADNIQSGPLGTEENHENISQDNREIPKTKGDVEICRSLFEISTKTYGGKWNFEL